MKHKINSKRMVSIVFSLIISISIVLLIIYLTDDIKIALEESSWNPIKERLDDYGLILIFANGLIQSFAILFTAVPIGIFQVLSGISLGTTIGILTSFTSLVIGNAVIFLFARKLGKRTENFYTDFRLSELIYLKENEKVNLFILLYFLPIVPYGLIAYSLSKTKIKFGRYVLLTTLAIIPMLVINNLLALLITSTYLIPALVLTLLMIIISIIIASNQFNIANRYSNKQVKNMEYFRAHVRKPHFILYYTMWLLFRLFFLFKTNFHIDKKSIKVLKKNGVLKESFLLVYNHPSFVDWGYAYIPLGSKRINSIIAFNYFCNYKFGKLLHLIGGFPKYLYQADISSIKNIKKVIKNNGVLGIAPEGRLSAYGVLEQLAPGTEKLIKHLNVPVVYGKIQGAYLTKPKWALKMKKGRVDITYEQIFTKDDISKLSIPEITDYLYNKFYYDDFSWQEAKQIHWKGKDFALGLENILYICPVCHHEFTTETKDNHIYCTHCNTDVVLNSYYEFESRNNLIPKNIRDWYLFQKEYESTKIIDPNFKLESKVVLKLPSLDGTGFIEVGQGTTTLTIEGLKYQGTIDNEEAQVFISRQNITAIPFGANEDFEIYYNSTMYYFIPENKRESVKYSVLAELIYNKYERGKS